MKNVLSYSDSVQQDYTFLGIIFMIVGISGFIGGIVSVVAHILGLVIVICATIKLIFAKQENADEMAEQYMNRAKARTMDYMLLVYNILAVISGVLVLYIDTSIRPTTLIFSAAFLILGINKLIIGLLFKKYEEE